MLDFVDVKQNSDEWFQLRAGRLTSSKMGTIMANYGKAFGDPAKKYAINIALEQITGKPIGSNLSNEHLERGHEEEPIARKLYEDEMFSETSNGGFFYDDFIGCSPDFICDDGLGEIKSALPHIQYARVKRGTCDPQYKWQCISNMYFTESNWIDFISYCSSYPEDKQLFVFRMNREDYKKEFEMLKNRISEFKDLVNECRRNIECET